MKGIIAVVDIPKNCAGCDYSRYIGDNFRCVINDTSVREHVSYQTKPKWCPIKAYDVVFVNCNQCEYFNTEGFSNGTGWCEKHEHGQSEDGYCSDALNKIQDMMK